VHELGIVQALIEQVEAVRADHESRSVVCVGLRIGSWRLVVQDSLEFYFEILTRGTALEGSQLEIETVAATSSCSRCGEVFAAVAPLLVCPACGGPGGELLTGQELNLVSVELSDD
jgi:hydrogenase nickel incorporation protein HypA/HybF